MIVRHLALVSILLTGPCVLAQTTPAPATPPATTPVPLPDAPSTISSVVPPPVPSGPNVVLDTTMGRLTCKLFDKQAPIASANFIGLAEGKKDWVDPVTTKNQHGVRFYDGVTFHRVIPGFMIQGGDKLGDGTGDAGYMFPNEVLPNLTFDVAGRLAMANAGPDTNGTQFFITELPQPDLDGKYTIFGQCDEHSVLTVATIARVDRDSHDKPYTPVVINRVTIVREGQPIPADPLAPKAPATSSPVPAIPAQTMPRPH